MQHSHLTVLHSEWPKLYGVLAVFECNRVIIANVGCKVLIKITLLLSHKGPKKKKKNRPADIKKCFVHTLSY